MHLSVDGFRDIADADWTPAKPVPASGIVHVKTEYALDALAALTGGPYVLVTHRSDLPVTQSMAERITPQVRRWFARNCEADHPRVEGIPIGLAERDLEHGNSANLARALREPNGADNLLLADFALDTHAERLAAAEAVKGKPWATVDVYPTWRCHPRPHAEYLRRLRRHRFALCPRGNGWDCHRTWEALYLGVTPVMRHYPALRWFVGLPILWVDGWCDVTEARMNQWNETHRTPLPFDERLFLPYWRRRFEEALRA